MLFYLFPFRSEAEDGNEANLLHKKKWVSRTAGQDGIGPWRLVISKGLFTTYSEITQNGRSWNR